MFKSILLSSVLSSLALLSVHATVTPSTPGPGDAFTEGADCTTTWAGDTDSTTVWKDMSIQLMTGSNFQMTHLTTVATKQDGTVQGSFKFPCPKVNPNSAIYFFQYSSPLATELTWTTRFTISGPGGATTPPTNPTQPGTGDAIPWGTGALEDPSTAIPPPSYLSGTPPTDTNTTTTTSTTGTSSSTTATSTSLTKTGSSASVTPKTSPSGAALNSSITTSAPKPTGAAIDNRSVSMALLGGASAILAALVL